MNKVNKLNVVIDQSQAAKIIFRLSGAINETFGPFAQQLATKFSKMTTVEFDMDGITMINSAGTREWSRLMLNSVNLDLSLTNCPKVFIDQVNMVDGFINKNCKIRSFYVPYFNEANGKEEKILFVYGEHFTDTDVKVETTIRGEAGVMISLDVIESQYFRFLKK